MKKIYSLLIFTILGLSIKAATYTITVSGMSYSPSTLTVSVGDVVTIQASVAHPLAQVDQTTWNANGTATLSTGWGTKTSNYTFTVTNTNTIYYVCTAHVAFGMKGQIVVSASGINENTINAQSVSLFPNPANEKLNIRFSLITEATVTIKLFDITGRLIDTNFENKLFSAGQKEINYTLPNSIQSGNYFIEIISNQQKITKKILVNN